MPVVASSRPVAASCVVGVINTSPAARTAFSTKPRAFSSNTVALAVAIVADVVDVSKRRAHALVLALTANVAQGACAVVFASPKSKLAACPCSSAELAGPSLAAALFMAIPALVAHAVNVVGQVSAAVAVVATRTAVPTLSAFVEAATAARPLLSAKSRTGACAATAGCMTIGSFVLHV